MIYSVLNISDGTMTFDLLARKDKGAGFYLAGWTPSFTVPKNGGVYLDNPLVNGSYLLMRRFRNTAEAFTGYFSGTDQDEAIGVMRDFFELLNKAVAYWETGWQSEPVWIEARSPRETYSRYSLIVNWTLPNTSDPYTAPFFNSDCRESIPVTLAIERRPFWTKEIPGTSVQVAASALQSFNSSYFGNVTLGGTRAPTTDAEVFFKNGHNIAQLTHILIDDGGVFSGNQIDNGDFDMLPSVPAVDDAIYFGSATGVTDAGPFSSLVFDIGQAGVDYTITWEYWNGSAWHAFVENDELLDNTVDFTETGVKSVHWQPQADWATTSVDSVTAWWVRARVSAVGGAQSSPEHQTTNPYTITWPYVEVQSGVLNGDVPALLRMKLFCHSSDDNSTRDPELQVERVVVGARSVDRGADFSAYLNISDEQVPSGITITLLGSNIAYADDVYNSITGRTAEWTPPIAASLDNRVRIVLDNTLAKQYYGKFHAFVLYKQDGGSTGDFLIRLRAAVNVNGNLIWYSKIRQSTPLSYPSGLDFGPITLPPAGIMHSETVEEISLWIDAEAVASGTIQFYGVVLIPTDEWAGGFEEAFSGLNGYSIAEGEYLDIDSVRHPKIPTYCPVRTTSNDRVQVTFRNVNTEPAQLNADTNVRLWFYTGLRYTPNDIKVWKHPAACAVQLEAAQQYMTHIGANA